MLKVNRDKSIFIYPPEFRIGSHEINILIICEKQTYFCLGIIKKSTMLQHGVTRKICV